MNGDREVLRFDLEDMYIEVLNNDFLPYCLKDYVQTTNPVDFKKSIKDIEVLRDFLSGRMLNISRDNAKVILNVLALPQTLKTEERVKITLMCRSLSMIDNFWTKEDDEELTFSDVCLRNTKLSEASYKIAILGKHISACIDDIKSDLLTNGMFAKTWRRKNNTIELWKTDKSIANINTKAEVQVSNILDTTNIKHVHYRAEQQDNLFFAVSSCFTNDNYSFVSAQEIKDYCNHIGISFDAFVFKQFETDFANMAVIDYILANTDRHFENWGFLIDNNTNEISSFSPLFDHNQALIADNFKTQLEDLIYEPTGESFLDTIKKYSKMSNLIINDAILPQKCKERFDTFLQYKENAENVKNEMELAANREILAANREIFQEEHEL